MSSARRVSAKQLVTIIREGLVQYPERFDQMLRDVTGITQVIRGAREAMSESPNAALAAEKKAIELAAALRRAARIASEIEMILNHGDE